MLGTILLIVLVLLLVGALPTWAHGSGWGYFPSGGIGLVLRRASAPVNGPYLTAVRASQRSAQHSFAKGGNPAIVTPKLTQRRNNS